ncbi:MAG: hypothetical protein IPL40_08590 [Proteobacteria bacterium]|nr:hypothetical protein [Pseudomonadota bacterium]
MSVVHALGRWLVFAAVVSSALPAEGRAIKLGIGLFAPELGLTPYEQFDEVDRLARHLATALGQPVVGRSYKVPRDLAADLRANRVQLALIGGFHLSSMSGVVKLLAVADSGPAESSRWSLMAAKETSLRAVSGQVLQLPNVSPAVADFVEFGLLEGNANPRKLFKVVSSPGLFSAVEAVRVGAAVAVLAPVDTKGLVPLLPKTLRVPPAGVVLLSSDLAPELVASLTQAVLSFKGGKRLAAGFVTGDLRTYQGFAANRRRQRLPLLPMVPETVPLRQAQWLAPHTVDFELPEFALSDLFVAVRPP